MKTRSYTIRLGATWTTETSLSTSRQFCWLLLLAALSAAQVRATVRYVNVNNIGATSPFTTWETAATNIQDAIDAANDGDQILVTNGVYQTGGRVANGALTNRIVINKPLAVLSVNGPAVTVICGYQVPGTTNGDTAVRCAYLTSGATLIGFTLTNGATATNFLGSSDDFYGGGVFCEAASATVSNCVITGNAASGSGGGCAGPYLGIFSPEGTLNNCVLSGNSAGSGGGASSCTLNNCTMMGNSAKFWGGGVDQCALNNCTLKGNSAVALGGGARSSRLNNCVLNGNSTGEAQGDSAGGGAETCSMTNCTLTGNSARDFGGGAAYCNLYNCVVYYNSAGHGDPNFFYDVNFPFFKVVNCCTTLLLPFLGTGNITNAPLFVDTNGWSNLRLQSNSPCINAGNSAYVSHSTDLDGRPRIVGGTVDIGAYEFQAPSLSEFIGWLQQYGLPTDGSADHSDPDADGLDTLQEWRCRTDPTNALSVLRVISALPEGADVLVSWASASGATYFVERSTNLSAASFSLIASNQAAAILGTNSFRDVNAAGSPALFYRVGVGP